VKIKTHVTPYVSQGCLCRVRRENGFSLFELTIVLIVVGLLVSSSTQYYLSTIENSKSSLIEFQAATFSRAVGNLYGQAKISNSQSLSVMDSTIYLNEKGWPATAERRTSVKSYNQSPEECERLWHGLFSNAPGTVIAGSKEDNSGQSRKDFRVYSINGRICRYELNRSPNGEYFFDYHLSSGRVDVYGG